MSSAAIPIRIRLVAGFALIMAAVLAAVGAFVYERTRADLDQRIDRELSARLAGVVAIVRDDGDDLGDPVQAPLERVDPGGIVQAIGPSGDVIDATSTGLLGAPLLDEPGIERLLRGEAASLDVERAGEPLRVVAARTIDDRVRYTTLVGAWLAERDEALSSLSTVLLIGGPLALLLAAAAAYWVATSALRPVEAMRRRAAQISERPSGARLPVPPARDEIASLGETLNRMLGRLERALERERSFVADASHELRTPLSILKAEIDLALAGGSDPGELREALESAARETNQLVRLAEDLLVIARADEGRLPVDAEPVAASEIAARVASRFAAHDRRVRTGPGEDAILLADPLRVEQALSNLVENALRYGRGAVTISVSPGPQTAELHVTDEGPGFPDEILDRAFERFARADRGGAGLGLAIVAAIAAAHDGSVGARNREQGGADVWIELPLAPAAEEVARL